MKRKKVTLIGTLSACFIIAGSFVIFANVNGTDKLTAKDTQVQVEAAVISEDLVTSTPAETESEDLVTSTPAETESEDLVTSTPAETESEDLTTSTPASEDETSVATSESSTDGSTSTYTVKYYDNGEVETKETTLNSEITGELIAQYICTQDDGTEYLLNFYKSEDGIFNTSIFDDEDIIAEAKENGAQVHTKGEVITFEDGDSYYAISLDE